MASNEFDTNAFLVEVSERLLATDKFSRAPAPPEVDRAQVMPFRIGKTILAVDILSVREILVAPPITLVPQLPHWIAGVMNFRNNIISVVRLAEFLGLEATHPAPNTVMVFAAVEQTIGMLVNEVLPIQTIDRATLEPPAPRSESILNSYLEGLFDSEERGVIPLIACEPLLTGSQMQNFSE